MCQPWRDKGEAELKLHSFLTLALVDVNGQHQAPADLPLGERTHQYPLNRRTCEPRANLDMLEMRKISSAMGTEPWITQHVAHSLHSLRYPSSHIILKEITLFRQSNIMELWNMCNNSHESNSAERDSTRLRCVLLCHSQQTESTKQITQLQIYLQQN